MPNIGLIVLAAGASTRLGQPKQLLRYRGRTLIRRTVEAGLASKCDPVVVVLGANAEAIAAEIAEMPIRVAKNSDWSLGMGQSLRVALEELERSAPEGLDAVVVCVCDQPLLTAAVIDSLVDKFREAGTPIVASRYADAAGVPALFSRACFDDLRNLAPAEGARVLLRSRRDDVATIDFPGGELDIDTAGDVDRLNAVAID